ncbi:YceI family protein [Methylibium sp.]|uniref:YceI family protein n=1 Tax=Methylibium sp. TaxID=2067992 RepID=UPI0017914609|nr:YceI family protein [Methylibium sp.]MBA3591330.1 YceI family protein [Methylibium sp.]
MKTPWLIWTLAGLLAAPLAQAQPAAARLLPAQSEIVFVSKQMGVPVEGEFKRFDAQIVFDPGSPQAGSVALTIDTGSATLGIAETDAELPKAEWFAAAKFPQARFQSTAIKPLGSGKYEVAGRLTIKGHSRDLVVPISLAQTGSTGIATGSFTLERLAFKIGDGEWADTSLVADDVQVRFKLALAGLAAP